MTGFKQIVDKINEFGEAFDVYKDVQDKRFSEMQERLEEFEAKGTRPGKTAPGAGSVAEAERAQADLLRLAASADRL
jgi:hypothetical protein